MRWREGGECWPVAEALWPGWLPRLLTHPVRGLDNYAEMIRLLEEEKSAIKVYVEVASENRAVP